jgi:hypothetical protein
MNLESSRRGEWQARDGVWRSFATEPPAFPGEVVATRDATAEDRAEDGVLAGVDVWKRFGAEDEPVLQDEERDVEVADIDEATLARWQLWTAEADG